MKQITGGVAAPQGFTASGIHCGVKNQNKAKKDLALIVSQRDCAAAGVYTRNRVKASPIYVTMEHLDNGTARAIVCNSGNANACAPMGHENAVKMCNVTAETLGIEPMDVVVASTGVIGQTLNIDAIEKGIPVAAASLSKGGSTDAAAAIMTTDTEQKELAVQIQIGGKLVTLGGIAKGSGMIHPNMGTMLCFITTDAAITSELLQEALSEITARTFNRVSVDGDTSTNDMCIVLANGMAENPLIEWKDDHYKAFYAALHHLCQYFARAIASDGEGATRLITCNVQNARSEETAERMAMAVIASPLVKTAMYGADANWGRVLCAMGYSKAPFRPEHVDIAFQSVVGSVNVCRGGEGLDFDEEAAKSILSQDEVIISINLNEGPDTATAWGCDLTYEYVHINGDYRT